MVVIMTKASRSLSGSLPFQIMSVDGIIMIAMPIQTLVTQQPAINSAMQRCWQGEVYFESSGVTIVS